MKNNEFEICGIHTRLRHLIKKTGGYDRRYTAEYIMRKYDVATFSIAYEIANEEDCILQIEEFGINKLYFEAIERLRKNNMQLRALIRSTGIWMGRKERWSE